MRILKWTVVVVVLIALTVLGCWWVCRPHPYEPIEVWNLKTVPCGEGSTIHVFDPETKAISLMEFTGPRPPYGVKVRIESWTAELLCGERRISRVAVLTGEPEPPGFREAFHAVNAKPPPE